ncbi:MAG: hypothetical protein RQ745_10390 [Longimicrobiales bacterium]|nr:hypothetical protein [Longimicrobiales bacterium]
MRVWRGAVACVVLGLSAGVADAQEHATPGPCPADEPSVRRFVDHLLHSETKRGEQEALGVTHVTGEPLRLLGDEPEDVRVCASLFREVPTAYHVRGPNAPNTVVFYQIGDRYILALTYTKIPERGPLPLMPERYASYDLDLNKVGGVVY